MKKSVLRWVLMLAILLPCLLTSAMAAGEEIASGSCGAEGDKLSWVLYSDGELVLSGAGAMGEKDAPWAVHQASITSLIVEEGITNIGSHAFSACTKLASVTLPKSMTAIDAYAFAMCTALAEVELPNRLTAIGDYAFLYCSKLNDVTIPDRVKQLGKGAFSGCTGLRAVTIGEGVIELSDSVFKGCTGLSTFTIPEHVTAIGDYAFSSCSNLTSVTIPEGVTEVGEFAFSACSNLASVVIPDTDITFGKGAFRANYKLTRVEFAGDASYIFGDYVFAACPNLAFYVREGSDGWTDETYYDAQTDTWLGRPVVIIPATAKDSSGYTCAAVMRDVPSDAWFFKAVDFVTRSGLMGGYNATTFGPDDSLNRAMLVQMLYNREGRPRVTGKSRFEDVADTDWYSAAVRWASRKGIASGYGTIYKPDNSTTRQELAQMLYNYAGKPKTEGSLDRFPDAAKVDDWAKAAVTWAVENGIMGGKGGGLLDPLGKATRAEAAQMLTNFVAAETE